MISLILGNVGEDISLVVEDAEDMPIMINTSNGSAVLVLTSPLDKEGVEGPSSIRVKITCEIVGTDDPGLTIPVTIR